MFYLLLNVFSSSSYHYLSVNISAPLIYGHRFKLCFVFSVLVNGDPVACSKGYPKGSKTAAGTCRKANSGIA
jgi:hypothetical protein